MLQQIGKLIVLAGAAVAVFGAILYLLGRAGLGRLPGDVSFGSKNWHVYLPIGTSVLVSVILTVLLYLIHRLRQ